MPLPLSPKERSRSKRKRQMTNDDFSIKMTPMKKSENMVNCIKMTPMNCLDNTKYMVMKYLFKSALPSSSFRLHFFRRVTIFSRELYIPIPIDSFLPRSNVNGSTLIMYRTSGLSVAATNWWLSKLCPNFLYSVRDFAIRNTCVHDVTLFIQLLFVALLPANLVERNTHHTHVAARRSYYLPFQTV